jgi:hypothetical protein
MSRTTARLILVLVLVPCLHSLRGFIVKEDRTSVRVKKIQLMNMKLESLSLNPPTKSPSLPAFK